MLCYFFITEKVTKKVLAFSKEKPRSKRHGETVRFGATAKMSQLTGKADVTDSLCVDQSWLMLVRNSRTVTVSGDRQIS